MPSKPQSPHAIAIEALETDAGQRVDRWLAAAIPDLSRARIQALIRDGAVEIDGAGGTIGGGAEPVKPGARYIVTIPEAIDSGVAAEVIALDVVYEDDDVIVIDKPAGLVVHPAAGHASGTLVNALIAHCGDTLSGVGGVRRPGIVHRLDKDTSGLLVVAKNDAAHAHLSEQFKNHGRDGRLHRAYLALAWGAPVRPSGVINAPLTRSATNRTKIAVARGETGREAITHYEIQESFAAEDGTKGLASLMRLQLETGRTHQIRVHLAHIGHPILGDRVYGAGFKTRVARLAEPARSIADGLARQALHAAELGFEHPKSGKSLMFVSALPADMTSLLRALKGGGKTTDRTQPKRSSKR